MAEPEPRPRTRWTDERLDDYARRVDVHDSWGPGISRLGTLVERIASELASFRAEAREDMRELRQDMRELRTEAALNRRWLIGLWATTGFGILGLLVEIGLR